MYNTEEFVDAVTEFKLPALEIMTISNKLIYHRELRNGRGGSQETVHQGLAGTQGDGLK